MNKQKIIELINSRLKPLEKEFQDMRYSLDQEKIIRREVVINIIEEYYIILNELENIPEREKPSDVKTIY